MKENKIWKFLFNELKSGRRAVLLLVVNSKGSSPGRAGFKLILSESGETVGTIGGGAVEHNLIMQAKEMLRSADLKSEIVRQIHSEENAEFSSGMICSGEQTVVAFQMNNQNLPIVKSCLSASENFSKTHFVITPDSFEYINKVLKHDAEPFRYVSETEWEYRENICSLSEIHIFGAGHVCLALCELLNKLDFFISIYDDRDNLLLMEENKYTHRKFVLSYDSVSDKIENNSEAYYLIMTHSHMGDAKVLSQLINKPYKYLGMMGSPVKVKEVFEELQSGGISREKLLKVHAPVGLPIHSKTVDEIAVSIAAELIKIKNAG